MGEKPFRDLVDDAEREIILRTLAFTRDNATEAARLLDLERGHFYKKMKALGIRRPRAHDPAEKAGAEVSDPEPTRARRSLLSRRPGWSWRRRRAGARDGIELVADRRRSRTADRHHRRAPRDRRATGWHRGSPGPSP